MTQRSWPEDVQQRLRTFAVERDWVQFHTPRNLVLALVGEVGELAELYQWDPGDAIPHQRVAEEIADVAIYLLRLADVVGVDIEQAVTAKIRANADRYPIDRWTGHAGRAGHEPDRS
jgi:dCTP diphosphatase